MHIANWRRNHSIMDIDSGTIHLDGDVIRYRSSTYGDWDLLVSDIRIVAEATNQNGPYTDDYFFCFATGPGMWLEASFYAAGRDKFIADLSAKLSCRLELSLQFSTDFASKILWPPNLIGKPMFKFTDVPGKTWLKRLFRTWENQQTYSDEVAEFLARDIQPDQGRV